MVCVSKNEIINNVRPLFHDKKPPRDVSLWMSMQNIKNVHNVHVLLEKVCQTKVLIINGVNDCEVYIKWMCWLKQM